MANKSSIIIGYTDHSSGKAQQKTITDINPQASNAKLATWGEMTAALTKDNYVKTTRIDRRECDNANTRPITEFTYNYSGSNPIAVPSNFIIDTPTSDNLKTLSVRLRTPIDSAPQVLNYSDNAEDYKIGLIDITYGGEYGWVSGRGLWTFNIASASDTTQRKVITPRTITFTLHFDATPNYDAYDQEFTFNITE